DDHPVRPGRRVALHRDPHGGRHRAAAHPAGQCCPRRRCRYRARWRRPGPPLSPGRQRTMSPRSRLSLALLWLALLLLGGWWISQHLQLTGDLRKFMPEARTPEQKLLIDEMGEGPGSRLLLLAISGDTPAVLARQSSERVAALADDPDFSLAANGADAGLESIPEPLRPYRYLLSNTLDEHALDAGYLADQLDARMQDLGSPAAALIEPLLPADPTLEVLALAESWLPANGPQRLHGVWFDRAGERALLAVQTR